MANNFVNRSFKCIMVTTMFAIVAGCGSSDDTLGSPVVIEPDIPTAVATSIPALVSFATNKIGTLDDVTEPLEIGAGDLASSETDEPDPSI